MRGSFSGVATRTVRGRYSVCTARLDSGNAHRCSVTSQLRTETILSFTARQRGPPLPDQNLLLASTELSYLLPYVYGYYGPMSSVRASTSPAGSATTPDASPFTAHTTNPYHRVFGLLCYPRVTNRTEGRTAPAKSSGRRQIMGAQRKRHTPSERRGAQYSETSLLLKRRARLK